MRLEGRNIHFGLGTDLISTQDLETGRDPAIHACRM